MTLLKLLITHLGADDVRRSLEHLEAVTPGPVVVCHGGPREAFDAIEHPARHFLAHPGLRGPAATQQSYDEALAAAWHEHVAPDPAIDRILVLEFDQVPLTPDFEARLLAVMDAQGADFLGKDCVDRTGTNWWHRIRYKDDPALLDFLRAVSVREDPTRIYGCLGSGFVLRRAVLEAMVAVDPPPGVYNELYLPTLAHHLGFRVDSVDRTSDLYAHVRWTPPFELAEVLALQRAGAAVVHPFKAMTDLPRLRGAA